MLLLGVQGGGKSLAAKSVAGAEIEQAVVSALYASHAAQESLTTDHIKAEVARTKPLSVLMAEKIAYLRAWTACRTVSA
jgi:hypothetical protein